MGLKISWEGYIINIYLLRSMKINELMEILYSRFDPPLDQCLPKYPINALSNIMRDAITSYYNSLSKGFPRINLIKEYLGCNGRRGDGRGPRVLTDKECVNCWTLPLRQAFQRPNLCSERGCVFFNDDHFLSHIRDDRSLPQPTKPSLLEVEISIERGRPETTTQGRFAGSGEISSSPPIDLSQKDLYTLWGWAYREINPHGRRSRFIQYPPWPLTFWFKFLESIENAEQKIDLANFWAFDRTPISESCDVCRLCKTKYACENCLPGVLLHNTDDVSRFVKANKGNNVRAEFLVFPQKITNIFETLCKARPGDSRGYLLLVGQAISEGGRQ